ncbi:ankyrin repeat and SOCS box protein 2-like [Poecilia reticulata]|uniref:ankyrin repeat and SOCS box protein 2-like n=1 Tax=Poecilia reticulata TaxID=8081 RepID=UPI0007E92EF7|nr:PREDICTED: ankyrin repeat and SOCS box protein 2-like [Poecilia reticulata]XP_017157645.1 PREDICTED: ankyrin repeat and SOCS box protein 2-like [Poecilia reticulata]
MASTSVSRPGSGGSGGSGGSALAFEEYSLYGNLTDDELLQLAIERSLTEMQGGGATQTAATQTARLQDNVPEPTSTSRYQRQAPSSKNPPAAQTSATYSSPNPPTEKPPDL